MNNYSVLYVHEGFQNPGDAIVFAAARALVNEHLDVLYESTICLKSPQDVDNLAKPSGPDYIILTGAPWIWENCVASDKYRALEKLFARFPTARRIAMGIGTSFLVEHDLINPGNLKGTLGDGFPTVWSMFQTIIVRDVLAQRIFESLEIKSTLLPCPSFLLSEFTTKPKDIKCALQGREWIIFAQDLRNCFIAVYLDENVLSEYEALTLSFQEKETLIIPWGDGAGDGSIQAPESVGEIVATMLGLAGARFFTSRVHAALTAISFGLKGHLYPIDSRSLTAMHCGCRLVGPYSASLSDVFKALDGKVFSRNQALGLYRSHLASAFGTESGHQRLATAWPLTGRLISAFRELVR